MNLGYNLTIEQSQKLVMTPELIQAIKILQFNTQELDTYVQEELMNNPVLEQAAPQQETSDPDYDLDYSEKNSDEPDVDWQEYLKDRQYDDISYRSHEYKDPDRQENTYEQYTASAELLSEHLFVQLDIASKDRETIRLGEYIIESLDENGYMTQSEDAIAAAAGASVEKVREVLELIRTFDPYGVGAADLGQCLMIQMKAAGILDDIYESLLTEHMDDLAAHRIQKTAKTLQISAEELQHRLDVIKMLEPKPGREFSSKEETRYIVPDIFVEHVEDDYVVVVNDDSVPSLMVSSYYQQLLGEAEKDAELLEYLSARMNSAVRLIKSIDQRKQTIWKVVNAVVDYQKDFFRYGSKHLKTLTLKQIADEVGLHESTVSRAVNGKYLQCQRGVFEIKHFFSAGVSGGNGGSGSSISSVSVKDYIKELVDGEDPKHPYSDQDLAEMLKARNISISRRTVAKYRDELAIPSSSKRKRY